MLNTGNAPSLTAATAAAAAGTSSAAPATSSKLLARVFGSGNDDEAAAAAIMNTGDPAAATEQQQQELELSKSEQIINQRHSTAHIVKHHVVHVTCVTSTSCGVASSYHAAGHQPARQCTSHNSRC